MSLCRHTSVGVSSTKQRMPTPNERARATQLARVLMSAFVLSTATEVLPSSCSAATFRHLSRDFSKSWLTRA